MHARADAVKKGWVGKEVMSMVVADRRPFHVTLPSQMLAKLEPHSWGDDRWNTRAQLACSDEARRKCVGDQSSQVIADGM
jgi:hypothetical protein